ncbi:MAG: response regulator [Draconibacterium sp.]
MLKFRIEILITLVAISLGIVVVTIGYFSYKSLAKIVFSVHQAALPDNRLYLIKDIGSDLTALEHSARLYVLTDNNDDLEDFYAIEDSLAKNIEMLLLLKKEENFNFALVDSFSKLTHEKVVLWNNIINVHLTNGNIFPAFSGILQNLSEQTDSSTQVGPSGNIDSTASKNLVERKAIKRKIQRLEWEIYQRNKQRNVVESQLIEKNVLLSNQINQLIVEAEKTEASAFLAKTAEADSMAEITYKRLVQFIVSAILLLLIALFVLYNYLKKTRITRRALTNAREKAENLALAKEQFAANVSHELRTPVNAIYGLSEQVLQKNLDSETAEMVSVVFKSARHLRNVVNDTLDFSKIQSKKLTLQSVAFSPAAIFQEVYSLLRNEAAGKGILLKLQWEGEKPAALLGDPLRLRQIVINLTGNAIKFTETGEVSILVTGFNRDENHFELEFKVADTGMGIDEKNLSLVFDEFVQLENNNGKKYPGTGLGLPIVKKLVELQGGKIMLKSKPGEGTVVTVQLLFPVADPSAIEQHENEITEIPQYVRQVSVLIADDEEYNRFLLKHIFKKWGIRFEEVKNGNEVTEAACNGHFDVILMDLNMPGIDGFEASEKITRCNKQVKIIAVTATNDQLDKQTCFDAGMIGILFKPFSERELFETIESAVRENRSQNNTGSGVQPVNLSELSRLAGGDEQFLVEMIQLFIKSMESGIAGIENSLKSGNLHEVAEYAHKMAAPVKHFGATHLYENIRQLEKISKNSTPAASVQPVFSEIKTEAEQLKCNLTAYLNQTDD